MKKTTFSVLFGISTIAVLGGAIMKIMHIPGAMILFASGFVVGSVISFVYSLFQAKRIKKLETQLGEKSQEPDSMKKLIINILFLLSSVAVLAGAYMVIMHFSGAYIVLGVGFVVGSVISSIDNTMKAKRIKELEGQLGVKV